MGLYVRLKIEETPVFKAQVARSGTARRPLIEAFKNQPREIFIASGVGLGLFCFFYVSGTYLNTYASSTLHLSRTVILGAGSIGGLVLAAGAVTSAILSDRVGRRKMIGFANVLGAVWALALVPVLNIASPALYIVAVCITMLCTGLAFGPLGAFLPELFRTRYRFTASAVSYNVGTVIGGSVAPLLSSTLTAQFGSMAFGLLLAGMCVIGAVCTFSLKETRESALDSEPVAV
jgi:MFS family permease